MITQKTHLSKGLVSVITCSLLSLCAAHAQSNETVPDENVILLDEFVVTGQVLYADEINALKSPTPVIDVPQSLSITTAFQIQDQGFDSVADIIDYTPGVNNAQGEGHRDAVVFRGSRSTASFFIDGVRDDVQYYRPLYNVKQLEILRGPNALLFGRGGTGGVINRVLKKGTIGTDFNTYQLTVDSFGAYGAQIDSNIAIGENAAFRINAYYDHLENHRDDYEGERFGINPTLRYVFSDATQLDVSYEYNDNERFIDRGIPTGADGRPAEQLDDVFFGDRELNESTFEAHVLRAALQHEFSDTLKGRLDLAYGNYDKSYNNLYASGYDEALDQVTLDGYVDSTQRESLTLSSGLIWELETGSIEHTFVAGLEYVGSENENNRTNTYFDQTSDDNEVFQVSDLGTLQNGVGINASGNVTTNDYSNPAAFNDDTAADLHVFSVYVQDEIALSEHLDLILGARYDRFDFEVEAYDVNGNLTSTRGQVDEEVTPRIGLVLKPEENISIYASYSQTFLPKSGEQFASISSDNIGIDPDEFINFEVGAKWDISSRMSLTAAVFELQQDSTQSDGAGGFFDIESEVTGFESQIITQITQAWFLSAGYSYLDGEIDDPSDPTVDGNRPRELPQHTFSIWNRYQLTEKFGLGLGLVYQDETYITEDNDTVLPSYTRVDAAAYYALSENTRIQINVENLFDEVYFPNAHGDHQVTVGAPINVRLAFTGRF